MFFTDPKFSEDRDQLAKDGMELFMDLTEEQREVLFQEFMVGSDLAMIDFIEVGTALGDLRANEFAAHFLKQF